MPRNLSCNVLGSSPHVQNLVAKICANIANVWFQKSRVSSRSRNVQVSVSSRVFAQSLGLVSVLQRQCLVSVSVSKILTETPALAKEQGYRRKRSPKKSSSKFFSGTLQFIGVPRIFECGGLNHKSHEMTSSKFSKEEVFVGQRYRRMKI